MVLPSDLAVLLVAHGTVKSTDELPAFLLEIRRGRPPSLELLTEMRQRYEAIGGSPLLEETHAQAAALARAVGVPVYVGMRYSAPRIADALGLADKDGVRSLVVLPMAPYSVPLYQREVGLRRREVQSAGGGVPELICVSSYGCHPELLRAHQENILAHAADALSRGARLILTAHSLPLKAVEREPSYPLAVAESAARIGLELDRDFVLAYQSVGEGGEPWLGPTLEVQLEAVAAAGVREVVVAPMGFLCEHVETLFDLDRQFSAQASARGIRICRVPALGTHSGLIAALTSVVLESYRSHIGRSSTSPEGPLCRE